MKRIHAAAAIAIMLATTPCLAQGNSKSNDDMENALAKIAALGPGVSNVKKDGKGRIRSCVVVGQSRISTVLGRPKGLETARQRASLDAKAQFVKWLKEKVSVCEKNEDHTITLIEGKEGDEKGSLKETGKAIESTSKKMQAVAEGLVRGMQNLHVEVSDKDKTYTVVMGWDSKSANATRKARKDLNSDEPKKTNKNKADKKIDDKESDRQ
jgi:hypothetical protein